MTLVDFFIFSLYVIILKSIPLHIRIPVNLYPLSIFVLLIILPSIFVIIFWKLFGATPGKMLGRTKIADMHTNEIPKTGKLIVRYYSYFLSIIFFGLGFIISAFTSQKQTLHDTIAETVVINSDNISKKNIYKPIGRDIILYKSNMIMVLITVSIFIFLTFLFFHDELLNPEITDWENECIRDTTNIYDNAFYPLVGFSCDLNSNPFEIGKEIVTLQRDHRPAKNFKKKEFPSKNISEMFCNSILANNLILLLNYSLEIDNLNLEFAEFDSRFDNIKNCSSYFKPYKSHISNTPFSSWTIDYFRLRLLSGVKKYFTGDKVEFLKQINSDHTFVRKMLQKSDSILMKINFTIMETMILKTYNFIIENETKIIPDLESSILSLTPLSREEKSYRFPLKNEYLVRHSVPRLKGYRFYEDKFNLLLAYIICKIYPVEKIKVGLSGDFSIFSEYLLSYSLLYESRLSEVTKAFLLTPNKVKNISYKELNAIIELSETEPHSYFIKTRKQNNTELSESALTYFGVFDWSIYAKYFYQYHDFDGYLSLLKLKLVIYQNKTSSGQIPEFLDTKSDSLYNPYTGKKFLWNSLKKIIYFEGPYQDESEDMREIKLKL